MSASTPPPTSRRNSRSKIGARARRLPLGSARCRRPRTPETFMRRWAEASPHAAPSPLVREGWGGEALLTRLLPPSRLARSAREATPDRVRGRLSPTRGEVSGASGQAFTKTITVAAVLLIGCMVALAADELAVNARNLS